MFIGSKLWKFILMLMFLFMFYVYAVLVYILHLKKKFLIFFSFFFFWVWNKIYYRKIIWFYLGVFFPLLLSLSITNITETFCWQSWDWLFLLSPTLLKFNRQRLKGLFLYKDKGNYIELPNIIDFSVSCWDFPPFTHFIQNQ